MAIVIKAKNIYGDIDNNKIVNNEIRTVNFSENNITVIDNDNIGAIPFQGTSASESYLGSEPLTKQQITERNQGLSLFYYGGARVFRSGGYSNQVYYWSQFKTSIPLSKPLTLTTLSYDLDYECTLSTPIQTKIQGKTTGNPVPLYDNYSDLPHFELVDGEQGSDVPKTRVSVLLSETTSSSLVLILEIVSDYSYIDYSGGKNINERRFVNSATITVLGQTFQVSSAPVSIGTGSFAQSLSYNELYQTGTKITIGETTEKIGTFLANKIINKWTNGKETAKLLVEYGEYYDTDGNLVKSVESNDKSMIFKIGEVVRPYVNSVSGDTPMSKNIDGTPKDFLIIGVEPFYDGACWQRLTLLEY